MMRQTCAGRDLGAVRNESSRELARIESMILTPRTSHRSDTPSSTLPPSPSLPTPFRHPNVPLITHRHPFIQTRPQPSQNSIFDPSTFPTSSMPYRHPPFI
ncbi:hypothetical protein M405DRAFT_119025 [Rhizopogon salebrosus TDB-379]|nr:hypothetical protein M405DRAFT_119025 [Rhizopogon salebrosus TDB-379]